jgi:GMP synthase-like glutamine amidotransferase
MPLNLKKILVFKHMPSQNPGFFRELAPAYNIVFDEIDLHAGDKIPDMSKYDGLWVMGGSMNIWEEAQYPWLIEEKLAIRHAVEAMELPFFGICFGHQLLAEAFGGEVGPTSLHEIGVFDITPSVKGLKHPFLANWPKSPGWANVHLSEVKRPPKGAVILAHSDLCDNHVMTLGDKTYSCQFHPEVCESTLSDWLEIPGIISFLTEKLGVVEFENFKRDITQHRPALNIAAEQLFKNWLSLVF